MMSSANAMRILIIDDNKEIHKDFNKILNFQEKNPVDEDELALFGERQKKSIASESYIIESAYQGNEALVLVENSLSTRKPYALAFVDIRMPPGWDGIKTIKKLWAVDPDIQVVIVSAYSEYTWEDILQVLGKTDNFLILKKPFETIEVRQFALALTRKWLLKREVEFQIENLNALVEDRLIDLKNTLSMTKATLEATAESILAISTEKKIVQYNKKFMSLFNLTPKLMKTMSNKEIFLQIADHLEEPSDFLNMLEKIGQYTELNELDDLKKWKLKSNKILEVHQKPHMLDGEIIGMVYSFRDVTQGYGDEYLRQNT